jgi:DNA/RNA endonuclease YhcR with UshA esterase domain
MTQTRIIAAAAGVILLAAATAAPGVAHHSFAAEFDGNKPVSLKGTVTKMEWINPHSWIHLDVRNPDGTVTKWMTEGGTPNTLLRRGFTKDSLKTGTEIQVEGFQAKNGAKRANGRDLVLPDGRRLFLGSSGTGAPVDGRDDTEK